jgi:ketosteroid isomerase-like protein
MRLFSISGLLLLLVSVALADAVDDVRCNEIRFSQSVENQNLESFRSFIDADARFVGGEVSRGPDEVVAAWGTFFVADGPKIVWRPQIVEVLHDGSLALSRGVYRMTVTSETGKRTDHWGTFNSIWRRQDDGGWKIVFDAGSPAAEAPADDVQALLERSDACGE